MLKHSQIARNLPVKPTQQFHICFLHSFYYEIAYPWNTFRDLMFKISLKYIITLQHGVQRRMISVDNFFVFLRLLFFAVLLLYVT